MYHRPAAQSYTHTLCTYIGLMFRILLRRSLIVVLKFIVCVGKLRYVYGSVYGSYFLLPVHAYIPTHIPTVHEWILLIVTSERDNQNCRFGFSAHL